MNMVSTLPPSAPPSGGVQAKGAFQPGYILAWAFCLLFYFLQYSVRSAPSVMMDELTATMGLTTAGLGSLLGLYYYTYSACSLISGASMDRWGAKLAIPVGTLVLAVGIAMFGAGPVWMAELGRLLQGAGAAFAFVGAVYLASHGFPARYLATAIGVTQCVGMLGGAMGQSTVAWLIHGVVTWRSFWVYAGVATAIVAVAIFLGTPRQEKSASGGQGSMMAPYRVVLGNPQSWLCGLCSGLLFLPTTVGSMTWGVSFMTHGWHMSYHEAVSRAAMVPIGWVFGCPILGYLADHLGRRKPVLFGGIVAMLLSSAAIIYPPPGFFPPYILAFILGFASGAAMIPYSVIKEVNPDSVKGSATGAINFLVFVMSAVASPLFGWFLQRLAGAGGLTETVFREGFSVGVVGIVLAGVVALFLRETGAAVRAG
ncbi:MFS transporter [Gluconacetobacter tumulicola]|uniref:Lysosomal dipeptide transporter MFSD1 n=1 Tax=Gluconacetobacter tumulicola TaxID=1017177 RepID=A0A7W4JAQ5_9PROT|nr:MFS transporter [Gluconacetobacter tumulicola]MBB2177796.1 MFS transporter [Gluconacetobacter tumulicola]